MRIKRLWHTVRWLRLVQVWGRLWFRIYRPRPDCRPAPTMRVASKVWQPSTRAASMTGPSSFSFLGVERSLRKAGDWNRTDWPKLWLYNLHYFDDLVADDAVDRAEWHRTMIGRWVADNPAGRGNGWEPYPTSLRIVNWVKWVLAGNAADEDVCASLGVQVRWLRRQLEIHLLGNHLWANAKALVFAGAYFQGKEANGWFDKGLALLHRELAEQILPDGGHFERSPMYHAIVLEDLLDLVQLASVFSGVFTEQDVQHWRRTALRMLHWLRVMTHPDGGIAFFNDAALAAAPAYAALLDYARSLGIVVPESALQAIEPLPESGFIRLSVGPAVLLVDVGEIGPDHLPAHAHADTLSYELSLHGKRVLVNGGTSTYDPDEERLRQRGTAAHNALEVEGLDSSEVWGSFRVGRRAHPFGVKWGLEQNEAWICGGHDGYRRIRNGGRVYRVWRLYQSRLIVEDTFDGKASSVTARFRGHPQIRISRDTAFSGRLRGDGVDIRWTVSGATNKVGSSTWHPGFGVTEPCDLLEVNLTSGVLVTEFTWSELSGSHKYEVG